MDAKLFSIIMYNEHLEIILCSIHAIENMCENLLDAVVSVRFLLILNLLKFVNCSCLFVLQK